MHDHKSEVVSKGVGYEEPVAGEVLEPDLGLGLWVPPTLHVDQSQPSAFALRIDLKRKDVTTKNGHSLESLLIDFVFVAALFLVFSEG